jgi:hypothetical protein
VSVFNKSKIKTNFNAAAKNYDGYAALQQLVARRVVDLAKNYILDQKIFWI